MKRSLASLRTKTKRLAQLPKRRPLLTFSPSPGLRGFWQDDAKRVCVLAANRVGKTRQAIAKLVKRMLEADRAGKPIRCRVVGPTNKVVNRTHARYMRDLLGDELAKGSNYTVSRGFNNENMAITRGGSTCEFCTYRQDPEDLASSSLHIVLLDEPPPPEHYDECCARVFDTDGEIWVTLTAVNRPVKWLKELVEQGVKERTKGARGWSFYQVPLSREACPWYRRTQIEEWKREARTRPWSYRQRIEAAWEGTSDARRFAAFEDRNQLAPFVLAGQGWPKPGAPIKLVLSVDHGEGPGHSHWVLLGYQVLGRTPYGPALYVRALTEWKNPRRMDVPQEARAVRDALRAIGVELEQVSFGVGDHNIASKSATARTLNELFTLAFAELLGVAPEHTELVFGPARKGAGSVEGQVAQCNALFASFVTLADGKRMPALQIADGCEQVLEALRHWEGKNDELKHAADAFRYGLIAIIDEVGWEPAQLVAA